MTPDMKRLVDVAERVCQEHYWQAVTPEAAAEAIVRSILTELRKPSASLEAACSGICIAVGDENVAVEWVADEMRAAIIDHILAEPTAPR